MIQGTASNAGKTILVAGLCRFFYKRGWKVCPFKAQNVTSNAFVINAGDEIGYAQYIQTLACDVAADVRMNPVLIKVGKEYTEFVINGKVEHVGDFREYSRILPHIKQAVVNAYTSLRKEYDLIIIEGAGSPAEINRSTEDISNMWLADYFQLPVVLISNVEYGGGFASVAGTLELLEERYRKLIKGFVFNKYDGEEELLHKGTGFIEKKYQKKFLGAIPYLPSLKIPEEDKLIYNVTPEREEGFAIGEEELFQSFEDLSGIIEKRLCMDELINIIS